MYEKIINTEGNEKNKNRNTEEKGYIRLYNLRNQKEKNNLLKQKTNNLVSANKNNKKKTLEERDQYLNNLYKQGLNFMEKIETERTKIIKEEKENCKPNTDFAWNENNKFFLEKIMQIFLNALKYHSKERNNPYEIDEENKFKEEEILNEKSEFEKKELKKFLFDFGFTIFDFSEDYNNDYFNDEEKIEEGKENNINNNFSKNNQNKKNLTKKEKIDLKKDEKNLVNLFVQSVIPNDNTKISSNDLFLNVIGILCLYDYFIYSSNKKTNPISNKAQKKLLEQENKNNNNNYKLKKLPKTQEEINLKNQIIKEIKEEIKMKSVKSTRYANFDCDDKLIITEENANNLKKDFHMFYLNFMFKHNIKKNYQNIKDEIENEFKQNNTFKPKIDENSKKLYSDYRRKILITETHRSSAYGMKAEKKKDLNDYIDNLILRKKKKEKY